MKSLMSLWREAANEMAAWCRTSAALDFKKLESRVKAEGVSFLTITLPQYAKDFERSLDSGSISPDAFSGFTRKRGLPLFLGGFLERIFDADGCLLEQPCVDSIFAVRQLTLMFGKIELPCSKEREVRAIQSYLKCEQDLERVATNMPGELLPQFEQAAIHLWSDALQVVEEDIYYGRVMPKHGPGATADRLSGNAKYNQIEWTQRLERILPYGDYALPSWRYHSQLDHVKFLEPGAERPVKVTLVPKTLKTPRVIAIEPTCMQYAQQAVALSLTNETEKAFQTTVLIEQVEKTFGFVGFEDQEVNRLLAKKGSRDASLATLDLSEASDRVLNSHVRLLFARYPHLDEAVQASRSLTACVPAHGNQPERVIPLRKFASMGSALCFPVEAMVFTTIVFAAIANELKQPISRKLISQFVGKVRVYGDDIVVPVEYVHPVIRYLEAFGLKVNSDKSFWTGKFRESCGGDFYDGHWVTPVRVRRVFPRTLADVPEVVSLVELRNLFYWNGMWGTAAYLDEKLERVLKGHFPIVEGTAAGLGRESVLPYKAERIHPHLHTPLVRGWRTVSTPPKSKLDDVGALLKYLLASSGQASDGSFVCSNTEFLPGLFESTFVDPKHLERQGRPVAVGIKRGWIKPY